MQQHKSYITRGVESSACNVHYCKCVGPIRWDNASILYKLNDFVERNTLETACIAVSNNVNFNISRGLFNLDKLTIKLIDSQFKISNLLN